MKIVGNSRAKVEIVDVDGTLLVKKSCVGSDAVRLETQIRKQVDFCGTTDVKTPHVYSIIRTGDSCESIMEFVSGLDFVSFTSQADVESFERAVRKIIKFVRSEFDNAKLQVFPKEKWNRKVEAVLSSATHSGLHNSLIVRARAHLIGSIPNKLLIGDCHGDLTFSNMIVERGGEVCLFDFLDPPVETPYEDVSKLLQDAEFYWTLRKYKGSCDETRVMIMWSHARKIIMRSLEDVLDIHTLRLFQVMTLMRIIPYTTDEKIIQFITDCTLRKLDEIDSSMRR